MNKQVSNKRFYLEAFRPPTTIMKMDSDIFMSNDDADDQGLLFNEKKQ